MELLDSHLHLDDPAFDPDRDEVIARAEAAGVAAMVTAGTSGESSRQAAALAGRHRSVLATVGIHPHEALSNALEAVAEVKSLLNSTRVVAVGETGLDFYRDFAPREAQVALFRAHLALARDAGLPAVVHCREAWPELMATLADYPEVPVVFHAFSGSVEIARACIERGGYLGIGGALTFRNSAPLRDVAAAVPMERILLETDAPLRGRRNEPAHLRLVAERLAEIRGVRVEAVAEATTANGRQLFRLPAEVRA